MKNSKSLFTKTKVMGMSIVACSLATSQSFAIDEVGFTTAGKIDSIQHYPVTKVTYAVNDAGWGHPFCPSHTHVVFNFPATPEPAFDYLLTQLAIANASKTEINFYAECGVFPYVKEVSFAIVK